MNKKQKIILGFIEIAQGFVAIISLGHIVPSWDFSFIIQATEKNIKKEAKK